MNKPIVAAITGVAFGIVLTGSIIHLRNQSRLRHCPHRAMMLQRTVVVPAPLPSPPPQVTVHDDEPRANDFDSILSDAQTEYVNGNYLTAISMAKSVQAQSPVRAWRIIGAASCNIKDLKLANESYRKLDAPGRQYMLYVCQRNGVVRDKRSFSLSD